MLQHQCDQCGKVFVRRSGSYDGARHFCSQICYWEYRKGKPHPKKAKPRLKKVCPVCGKTFETGGWAGKAHKIYCSRQCSGNARRIMGRNHCAELSQVDAAYMAGFFDGEGCVVMGRRPSGGYTLTISVNQSVKSADVLYWMQQTTGVGSNVVRHREPDSTHAAAMRWQLNSDAAEELLRQMLPHLKVKKPQAELAIAFQERRRNEGNGDKTWQQAAAEELHRLNRRGPVPQA